MSVKTCLSTSPSSLTKTRQHRTERSETNKFSQHCCNFLKFCGCEKATVESTVEWNWRKRQQKKNGRKSESLKTTAKNLIMDDWSRNLPTLCRLDNEFKFSEMLPCNCNCSFCIADILDIELDCKNMSLNWLRRSGKFRAISVDSSNFTFVIFAQTLARRQRMKFLFIFLSCCCFLFFGRPPSRAHHSVRLYNFHKVEDV